MLVGRQRFFRLGKSLGSMEWCGGFANGRSCLDGEALEGCRLLTCETIQPRLLLQQLLGNTDVYAVVTYGPDIE
jgi:hypothetical protein